MSELRTEITPEEVTAVLMAVRLGVDMAETCVALGVSPRAFYRAYDGPIDYRYWAAVGLCATDTMRYWDDQYEQRIDLREVIGTSLTQWQRTQKEAACSTE